MSNSYESSRTETIEKLLRHLDNVDQRPQFAAEIAEAVEWTLNYIDGKLPDDHVMKNRVKKRLNHFRNIASIGHIVELAEKLRKVRALTIPLDRQRAVTVLTNKLTKDDRFAQHKVLEEILLSEAKKDLSDESRLDLISSVIRKYQIGDDPSFYNSVRDIPLSATEKDISNGTGLNRAADLNAPVEPMDESLGITDDMIQRDPLDSLKLHKHLKRISDVSYYRDQILSILESLKNSGVMENKVRARKIVLAAKEVLSPPDFWKWSQGIQVDLLSETPVETRESEDVAMGDARDVATDDAGDVAMGNENLLNKKRRQTEIISTPHETKGLVSKENDKEEHNSQRPTKRHKSE
jgi:hypothetical protein